MKPVVVIIPLREINCPIDCQLVSVCTRDHNIMLAIFVMYLNSLRSHSHEQSTVQIFLLGKTEAKRLPC